MRPPGVDLRRIHHSSLCVACRRPGSARASSRTPARRHRQDLLANMARFRRGLPDDGRRRAGRRSRRLRLVSIGPLLRPSQSFSQLPCSNVTSTITSLRAETSVSPQSCGIVCSEQCSDDEKRAQSINDGLKSRPALKPQGAMCPHYAEQIDLDTSRNNRK